MSLIDSLLGAIVKLEGDSLVLHTGEKPYVVTSSSSQHEFRGPLAWGQVELSTKTLSAGAVMSILEQLLERHELLALSEMGAVEHILPERADRPAFQVVAARGGDDIWVEVRPVRPKAAIQAPVEPEPVLHPEAAPVRPSDVEGRPRIEVVPEVQQEQPDADAVAALLASSGLASGAPPSAPDGSSSAQVGATQGLLEEEQRRITVAREEAERLQALAREEAMRLGVLKEEAERLEREREDAARAAAAAREDAARAEAEARQSAESFEHRAREEAARLQSIRDELLRLEQTREEAARSETLRMEAVRAEAAAAEAAAHEQAARLGALREEAVRAEAAAREQETRVAALRDEAARAEAMAGEQAARIEALRHEAARLEAIRDEAARTEAAAREEAARVEALRAEAARLEGARGEVARAEAAAHEQGARVQALREEAMRVESAAREQETRVAALRDEAARLESVREEVARAEAAAREEASRVEALRQEAARLDAVRAEAERTEAAARQEAARVEALRVEAARLEAARDEAAHAEALVREQAARVEALREEAARLEAARAEAAALEAAAREEAARLAQLRNEAQTLEAARAEAARIEEVARAEAARVEQLRREAERLDAMRAEAAALQAAAQEEGTRVAVLREEAARLEAVRAEAARVEAQAAAETARLAALREEAARLEAARAEADREKTEAREEAVRVSQAMQAQGATLENARLEIAQLREAIRQESERLEATRSAAAEIDEARRRAEHEEQARIAAAKEVERLEQNRLAQLRAEAEKAEAARREQEAALEAARVEAQAPEKIERRNGRERLHALVSALRDESAARGGRPRAEDEERRAEALRQPAAPKQLGEPRRTRPVAPAVEATEEPQQLQSKPELQQPPPSTAEPQNETLATESQSVIPAAEPPAQAESDDARPAHVLPLVRSVREQGPAAAPAAPAPDLDRLLRIAAARGASGLYLVSRSQPAVRVDGDMQTLDGEEPLAAADVEAFTLGLVPEPNRDSFRSGATVEWFCDVPEIGRVRCLSFRDHRGPGVIIRMLPARAVPAEQLGLSKGIQALAAQPDGLVLITGPRASGKSTLLAAFVDLINRTRADHVITIERQVTFLHQSHRAFISQREVRGEAHEVLAAVRAALREDPDVLVVEELRSPEVVSAVLESAESGRLVLAGVRAPASAEAIERLMNQVPPDQRGDALTALATSLRGVVAQVLLRKRSGGRVAARELLLNTPAAAAVLAEGKLFQLGAALESGRKLGSVPLNDNLFALIRDGAVDPAEAWRKAHDREGLLTLLKREGIDTSFVERLA